MGQLTPLPCLDSRETAASLREELTISHEQAATLGQSAVEALRRGFYLMPDGQTVMWRAAVQTALVAKLSIPPNAPLPRVVSTPFHQTRVQVSNETTLGASRRLVQRPLRPLALNFANGVIPGGGFLDGARAQEEVLCRSSALFATLVADSMYEEHAKRPQPDSTDWVILSPDVPVFRTDGGVELEKPWPLSIITCAAPYAPGVGQPLAAELLCQRIHRVMAVARAYGYSTLVLGAWGCGAFGNDPHRTALDFRAALEGEFDGTFAEVIFAIADWSPDRKTLGPFRDVFASELGKSLSIPTETLLSIQKHFHAVIRERAGRLIDEQRLALPELAPLLSDPEKKMWLPVPGMYGGFKYWLEGDGENAVLISESWIRVVENSGERHEITARGSRLVDEGFV